MSKAHLDQIHNHALETYPEECCGLLLGKINNYYGKKVIEVRATPNSWDLQSEKNLLNILSYKNKSLSKKNRFSIAPEVILKIQKEARNQQLQIIGVYHSHPNYPAIPSEFDLAIAWPEYSYVIISVNTKKKFSPIKWLFANKSSEFDEFDRFNNFKSWGIDDRGKFQEEEIKIIYRCFIESLNNKPIW